MSSNVAVALSKTLDANAAPKTAVNEENTIQVLHHVKIFMKKSSEVLRNIASNIIFI